jgi:hypothetical protein
MADAVTSQVLFSGNKRYVGCFTNTSDGTGESAVTKVDISGLTGTPTTVTIKKVWYSVVGMSVKIIFDKTTTDEVVLVLSGDGEFDLSNVGGIPPTSTAAGTNDILFTTVGHTSGDTYTIILELVLG